MNRQDIRSAVIAAAVAALVAAPLAGADAVETIRHAVSGGNTGHASKTHHRTHTASLRRGPRGQSGPTGATGATGATGSIVDPAAVRWRAASPFQKITPADGVKRLVAACPSDSVAIDGGYTTGDAGDSIRILGFERITSTYGGQEGYALTVRAIGGSGGYPQVRAFCAEP
ncbi:MAG: hypothetical protein HY827_00960 [Actinobacteria bacterium]|nr:hypothetical protein [Actinomycetota bacterium]